MKNKKKKNSFVLLVSWTAIVEAILLLVILLDLLYSKNAEKLFGEFISWLIGLFFLIGVGYIFTVISNWSNGLINKGLFIRQLLLSILIAISPLLFFFIVVVYANS